MPWLHLTDAEKIALIAVIDSASDDHGHYLTQGDPFSDYGCDWPEVAATRAEIWKHVAQILESLGLEPNGYLALAAEYATAALKEDTHADQS